MVWRGDEVAMTAYPSIVPEAWIRALARTTALSRQSSEMRPSSPAECLYRINARHATKLSLNGA